jgi:hypothetical protein
MTERISPDAATEQAEPVDCGPPTPHAKLIINLKPVELSPWKSMLRKVFKSSAR